MSVVRRTTIIVLTAAAAVGTTAAPAFAAVGDIAPSCVARQPYARYSVGGYRTGDGVKWTNNCGRTVRVRVIWNNAFDGSCTTIDAGRTATATGSEFARYDKTVTC